jgi:DNA-binding NtrC family response regulator
MAKILVIDDDKDTHEFVQRALADDHEIISLEKWRRIIL